MTYLLDTNARSALINGRPGSFGPGFCGPSTKDAIMEIALTVCDGVLQVSTTVAKPTT